VNSFLNLVFLYISEKIAHVARVAKCREIAKMSRVSRIPRTHSMQARWIIQNHSFTTVL
jgi:chemotaxis signal transduction protein